MADSVSPACTTYLVAGPAVGTGAVAALSVLVRMTWVMLLFAVRVLTWAGGADPVMLITKVIGRMIQASTTHADLVHVRIVLSLSFQGDQRRALLVRGAEEGEPVRKERT